MYLNVWFISLGQVYFQIQKYLNFSNASNSANTHNVTYPKTQVAPNPIEFDKKKLDNFEGSIRMKRS